MKFKTITIIFFVFSIFTQIVIVLLSDGSQIDDSKNYLRLAYRIIESGQWYPNYLDIHPYIYENDYSYYIHSPGYVNYLAFCLMIVKSVKGVLFINILINAILGYELFYIGKKYFNEKTAYIVLFLFSIYPTNYAIILLTGNELIYTMSVFTIILLYLKDKTLYIILSGILTGYANWMRPFLPVLLMVICFIAYFCKDNLKHKVKNISIFILSLGLTIFIIGYSTYQRFDSFIIQSTTGGYNLLVGANDKADGSFSKLVFQKGNLGYITPSDNLTTVQLDQIWRKRAIHWIENHPVQWMSLFPKKFFYMYIHDSHAMNTLSGNIEESVQSKEYTLKMIHNFPKYSVFQWLLFYNQLFYMVCITISLIGVYFIIKEKNRMGQALLLFWIMGTAMNLILIGGSKFHYPYMPVILLCTSFVISKYSSKFSF